MDIQKFEEKLTEAIEWHLSNGGKLTNGGYGIKFNQVLNKWDVWAEKGCCALSCFILKENIIPKMAEHVWLEIFLQNESQNIFGTCYQNIKVFIRSFDNEAEYISTENLEFHNLGVKLRDKYL